MNRLRDKTAIVSGAGNGIGRAISHLFAEEGAWVLVTDIDAAAAKTTAMEICKAGGAAEALKVDIGSPREIEEAVQIVGKRRARVDILCNNAAFIGEWHSVGEATAAEWTGCLQTTILGTQNFTRAVLPLMIPNRSGSIIVMSSIMGMVACPDSISYSTVKAGLIGFARSAACDLGKHNIRVNAICPGPIRVRYSPPPGHPSHDYQIRNTFLGRTADPREVGYAALFLASDESSFVTGAVLPVDGGWTAM